MKTRAMHQSDLRSVVQVIECATLQNPIPQRPYNLLTNTVDHQTAYVVEAQSEIVGVATYLHLGDILKQEVKKMVAIAAGDDPHSLIHHIDMRKSEGAANNLHFARTNATFAQQIEVTSDDLLLTGTFVHPHYEGRRIGTHLLTARMQYGKEHGSTYAFAMSWDTGRMSRLYDSAEFTPLVHAQPYFSNGANLRFLAKKL